MFENLKSLSKLLFLFSFILISFIPFVWSDDIFVFVVKKEEQKKKSRWNIGDWLITKEKMRLMDQWLALHSSNPFFEGVISGGLSKYKLSYLPENQEKPEQKHKLSDGYAAFYFSIFGFEIHYVDSDESFHALSTGINLRLIGNAVQGTHLTLQMGHRKFNEEYDFRNYYIGGNLSLYLISFIGVEGLFRYYLPEKAKDSESILKGRKTEMGAFIDVSFLRIFGNWFTERLEYQQHNLTTTKDRKGLISGIKVFF